MLERYSREEMLKVWTDDSMYRFWLEIEIAVCEAYAELGKIPQKVVERIRDKADFDIVLSQKDAEIAFKLINISSSHLEVVLVSEYA